MYVREAQLKNKVIYFIPMAIVVCICCQNNDTVLTVSPKQKLMLYNHYVQILDNTDCWECTDFIIAIDSFIIVDTMRKTFVHKLNYWVDNSWFVIPLCCPRMTKQNIIQLQFEQLVFISKLYVVLSQSCKRYTKTLSWILNDLVSIQLRYQKNVYLSGTNNPII